MMRSMTLADIDAVLAVEQAVQPYPWTGGNFADAIESGYLCCVDEDAGVIRGYAVLMPGVGEAEVLTLAVAPACQRKGVGTALLANMLAQAWLRGMLRVFLEVRVSNLPAISLYRRAGFGEVGMRRGYYRNADGFEDALVMGCDVPSGGVAHG